MSISCLVSRDGFLEMLLGDRLACSGVGGRF